MMVMGMVMVMMLYNLSLYYDGDGDDVYALVA